MTLLNVHPASGIVYSNMRHLSTTYPTAWYAERLNAQLLKRNAELERKLHIANVLIALQKKAHELLGIALPESDGDD